MPAGIAVAFPDLQQRHDPKRQHQQHKQRRHTRHQQHQQQHGSQNHQQDHQQELLKGRAQRVAEDQARRLLLLERLAQARVAARAQIVRLPLRLSIAGRAGSRRYLTLPVDVEGEGLC